jgi:AbrB family looped-hinge helix DNA binding protein
VVIPKDVREKTHIRPGEKLQILCFDDRIELVRTHVMHTMRGFLSGMDATFIRDEQDRT